MAELLACRVCLATDNVKLYDMLEFNFVQAYEVLTGNEFSLDLPHHICSYCSALLLKSVSFKEKCCTTQQVLLNAAEQQELSLENLRLINHQFELHLVHETNYPTVFIEHLEPNEAKDYVEPEIKEEVSEYLDFHVKEEKPKKRKKKKIKQEVEDYIKLEEEIHHNDSYDIDNLAVTYDSDVITEEQPTDVTYDSDVNADEPIAEELKDVEVVYPSKAEQLLEIEQRKLSSNYLNSFYKCDKCYKGFITDATYRNHMQSHNEERGSFVCEICQSRWAEPRQLRTHMMNSHARKFMCKLCDHVSRSTHRAKEHSNWHNGFKFDCKICGASFAKSTSHLTHIRLHHPSSNACDICGESFIGEFGVRIHKRKAHSTSSSASCPQCGAAFLNVQALARHLALAQADVCDQSMRPCPSCGEGYPSEEELKEHVRKHHTDESVSCEECKRSFNNERSYAIHYQRVHLGVKMKQYKPRSAVRTDDSVVCEICGKKCIVSIVLAVTHQCKRSFNNERSYAIHYQRVHLGVKMKQYKPRSAVRTDDSVVCEICGKKCIVSIVLAVTHQCKRSFNNERSYAIHYQRVHLGVKMKQYKPRSAVRTDDSVVCEICGKKCIVSIVLAVTHQCKRSFNNERSYAIHYQRVHLGVKMKQYKPR